MVKSPAGRRGRRADGPTPEQWLELPGWRKPLDALLVVAATFATAWVGLVVIPAAANSSPPAAADTENDASPPSTDPSTDPREWFAGPVYTRGPAAPPTEQTIATELAIAAEQTVAPRAPAPRAVSKRTTTQPAPRTTRAPAPKTTVAAAVAAATTPAVVAATTTAAETAAETTAETTAPAATTTEPPVTTPSTTSEETTSSSTSSSEAAPGG